MIKLQRNVIITALLFIQLGLASLPANGQYNARIIASDIVPTDPDVRYGQLDNGFTYYIRHNNRPKEQIELHMVVKAGDFHEDEDQLEYAHLLEHMGAKGTVHFPRVHDRFRSSGAYSQATTRDEFTSYYTTIPSGDSTLLKDGLQILRDWAQGILLEPESIDVERGAVLGEMRKTIDPHKRWLDKTVENFMLRNTGHTPYDIEKHAASIRNFRREPFVRFYNDWYRPDLQAAIIVGDINVDSVEVEIKRLFSDLKMPEQPRDAEARVAENALKLSRENQYAAVIDSIRPDYRLYILPKRLNHAWRPKTKADYRDMLLQKLYQELLAPRLTALRKQYHPPFEQFNYNYYNINWTQTMINLENDRLDGVKEKFIKVLTILNSISAGFTEAELSLAKATVMEEYSNPKLERPRAMALRYRDNFVGGTAAPDPEYERELVHEILEQITLDDIETLAGEYFNMERNTNFLFFHNGKVDIPDSDTIKRWVSEVNAKDVQPYIDKTEQITSLKGVTQIPFQNSVSVKSISENLLGVTTMELSNDIKLVLKPTGSRSQSNAGNVSIRAYRPNGIPLAKREDFLAGIVAGEAIRHAGAGPYDKFALEEYMAKNGIRLNIKLDNTEQTIRGSSKENNLEDLLRLFYLYTNSPRKDPEAFRDWKNHKREELSGNGARTVSNFYVDKIDALRYPEIPAMKLEDLNQLTMEKVYSVYDEWFSDFGGYTFIVTGDFDKDQLTPLLVKYLSAFSEGNFPSPNAVDASAELLTKMNETIYISNLKKASIELYFPVVVPTDVKTKIILSILGKALDSRIWDRLREGDYSPAADGRFVETKNGLYQFEIMFDSKLSNEDNMIRYAMEEFRLLRDKGIDEQLFENLLAKEKEDYERRIDRNRMFWYNYLKEKQKNGEDPKTEVLQYQTVLEHFISLKDVNTAAKKYLSEEYFQQFVVLPEGYQQEN